MQWLLKHQETRNAPLGPPVFWLKIIENEFLLLPKISVFMSRVSIDQSDIQPLQNSLYFGAFIREKHTAYAHSGEHWLVGQPILNYGLQIPAINDWSGKHSVGFVDPFLLVSFHQII